jgi:hypothetical protein
VGATASFVAAYALVLNVILSSIFVAGLPPQAGAPGYALCLNSANPDASRKDSDQGGQRTVVHCPLCVGHLSTGALPPPEVTVGERIPVQTRAAIAFHAQFVAPIRTFNHQSRGPPALI